MREAYTKDELSKYQRYRLRRDMKAGRKPCQFEGGCLYFSQVEKDLCKIHDPENKEVRSRIGKAGAKARWKKIKGRRI